MWEVSAVLSPPGEEVPAVLLPVILHDVLHALLAGGQDGEPGQDSPEPVLLTDVVGACRDPQQKHVSHLLPGESPRSGSTLPPLLHQPGSCTASQTEGILQAGSPLHC